MALNNLATSQSEVGYREEALASARGATDLYQALAAVRPEAYKPGLAMSLANLAKMLSRVGRREEALEAAQEAVQIRRALAAESPEAFASDLALSLNSGSAGGSRIACWSR